MSNHIWNEKCENEKRIRALEERVSELREVLGELSYALDFLVHEVESTAECESEEQHVCNCDCAVCDDYTSDTYDDAECCCPSKKAPTKVKIHKVRMCCH